MYVPFLEEKHHLHLWLRLKTPLIHI